MTKWVVFEAGSRAGLSARLFYEDYYRNTNTEDILLMADDDRKVVEAINNEVYLGQVRGINTGSGGTFDEVCEIYYSEDSDPLAVFPADELTRQRMKDIDEYDIPRRWFNDVSPNYYNKSAVNARLAKSGIRVPQTFELNDVFIKPNTLSAGSRGLQSISNACVQRKIDIDREYVVDCFVNEDSEIVAMCAREVQLRSGYDKLIRLLSPDHRVCEFAEQVITASKNGMFRGVCHLQIVQAKETGAPLYYIEGSKRISGTSLVNLLVGYNPFRLLAGEPLHRKEFDNEWHSYEELYYRVIKRIYEP